MAPRTFANAGAQSTCTSPITAVQTTVTLVSASGFPSIRSGTVTDVIILDSGNPSFDPANPLATNYEYQPVTSIATNTLTFGGGSRAAYAGTTPKSYLAGATVAAVTLAEGLRANPGGLHGIDVWDSVAESINSGSFIHMPFNQTNYDPEGLWDAANRRYTAPVAGMYLFHLGWFHNGSACRVIATLGLNGTDDVHRCADQGSAVAGVGSRRLRLAANDQIYPEVWQNSGVAVNTFGGTPQNSSNPFFTVQFLGET